MATLATYNERENLARLLQEIQAVVPSADLLVIDDNSPDGTGKLVDELAAADGRTFTPCTGPASSAWARRSWPASPSPSRRVTTTTSTWTRTSAIIRVTCRRCWPA